MKQIYTAKQALEKLKNGNRIYLNTTQNLADISPASRHQNSTSQQPYALVLSCSDSRVPPEHIFQAGIGELFVIRTAGNVVGDFTLGSMEYAITSLHVPLIIIMGHSHCGAVKAALNSEGVGYMKKVVDEVKQGIKETHDKKAAVYNNILHSHHQLMKSTILQKLLQNKKIFIQCAYCDIDSGEVSFFHPSSQF
ncbi:MAG: carbonic anhydrase [Breznakia sp.]